MKRKHKLPRVKRLPESEKFIGVVSRLRKECPWDRKQTHKSLIPYLLEETYETIEAIESKNDSRFCEELGDLLLQVALHAVIAEERGKFDFDKVSKGISEKMIRRHPHVFGDKAQKIKSAEDQLKNWSKLKSKEKPNRSLLAGTPKAMPALQLAQRYGEIAASVNFRWPELSQVIDKVNEEWQEVQKEISRKKRNLADLEMEIGDLLFVITRLTSYLGLDAERALRQSSAKFQKRFSTLETLVRKAKRDMAEMTLSELETLWHQAKGAK